MGKLYPLESAVVERITRYLKTKDAWWVKTTGVSKVGCPDLLVCYRGWFIAIEVKRSDKSGYGVTRKQQLELERVQRAGGYSLVAYSADDVRAVVERIDRDATRP